MNSFSAIIASEMVRSQIRIQNTRQARRERDFYIYCIINIGKLILGNIYNMLLFNNNMCNLTLKE